jgi:hypothetical protein
MMRARRALVAAIATLTVGAGLAVAASHRGSAVPGPLGQERFASHRLIHRIAHREQEKNKLVASGSKMAEFRR